MSQRLAFVFASLKTFSSRLAVRPRLCAAQAATRSARQASPATVALGSARDWRGSAETGRQAAPHAAFSQRKLFGLGKS